MTRVEMEPGWEEYVYAACDRLFTDKLGPDIAADARRYCPVDTGALRESIEHHLEGHDLIVSASGGADGRIYAAYVELGHRVYHPSTGMVGPERVAPEPFMRSALYQARVP